MECKRLREKGDEKFQTFILDEVATIKNNLVLEAQQREQCDDDIVQVSNAGLCMPSTLVVAGLEPLH